MKQLFLAAMFILLAYVQPSLALPRMNIEFTAMDFQQVTLGQTSTIQLPVWNIGDATLTVDWLQFSDNLGSVVRPTYPGHATQGNNQYYFYTSDFSALSPISISPGQFELINIVFDASYFSPSFVGEINGTIWVYSSTPGVAPVSVSYHGESVALPLPTYTLSPTSFDLGTLNSGDSVTRQYTVTNTSSTADLHVSGYSYILSDFSGAGNLTSTDFPAWNYGSGFSAFRSDFSSYTITPGGQQAFSFTYFATTVGSQSGTIELNSDGTVVGVAAISFTATVQELTPSPNQDGRVSVASSLNFGDIILGQTGTANLGVSNTGTGALDVWAFEILGVSGFPSVSVAGETWAQGAFVGLENTLLVGQTVVVPIQLTPAALGTVSGSFTLWTSDPTNDNHVSIPFIANVVAPPPPAPPPPAAFVEPPPVPGASFFWWDEGDFGRHFYTTDKLATVKSVLYDYGDGSDSGRILSTDGTSTAKATNPLHIYDVPGSYKVALTMEAQLNGRDTTFVSRQSVLVGPAPAAVDSPRPTDSGYTPPANKGSKITKAANKAGGGKTKRPAKVGKVVAIQAAPGGAPATWGQAKASQAAWGEDQ